MFNSERFDFKILSVLRLRFGVSARYSPKRPYHALIFRIHGKAEVALGDDRIRLNKNDVTFVPRGCDYNISTMTDEEVIVVHFNADFSKEYRVMNMHACYPEDFASLFDRLLLTYQNKSRGFVYRLDSLFLSILEQIEKQSIELNTSSPAFRIQRAVDLMHTNISNPAFSVDELASKIGYCSSYFRRIFNSEMGVSPKEYLLNIRFRHAIALLESGYYSVEQVSELCGFTSSKYFSTAIKRMTKKCPSSYIPYKANKK